MSQNARMERVGRLIPILVVVALLVGACGGSDGDDGSGDAAATDDSGTGDDGPTMTESPDDTTGTVPGGGALADAIASIDGLEVYENQGRNHVEDPTYDITPPPGGDHLDEWVSCGFYDQPVSDGQAVHSLEHGAVWVAHQEDLAPEAVQRLESLANVETHLLVSPYPDLETPLMLVAWGVRLPLGDVNDPRFDTFLTTFIRGPQTPEPGVVCQF